MSAVGHFKLTYPADTPKGIKRGSWRGKVSLVLPDGQEITMPGVSAFKFDSAVHEPDRVTLECIGTVEVIYGGEGAPGVPADWHEESDEATKALIEAVRES